METNTTPAPTEVPLSALQHEQMPSDPAVVRAEPPPPKVLPRDDAEELGRDLQRLACAQAVLDHDFCTLVDQFDAGVGITWFEGIKSTAHFLAFSCSMSPHVAREHVRVARALRQMPRTDELFAQGRLSYSKVRELTRVAGEFDEQQLLDLALEMTASQLARTVQAYRSAPGTRILAEHKRRYSLVRGDDHMVRISICLPAEEAALITAAIESARRRSASDPTAETDQAPALPDVPAGTPRRPEPIDRVQALLDVAAGYLDTLPGEPDDDHTVVMVHVNAGQLASAQTAVAIDAPQSGCAELPPGPESPADAELPPDPESPADADQPNPLAPDLRAGTCFIEGHGAIEPATAQRLACTATLVGVLLDADGVPLHLGRAVRLATRAQRRALRVRDHGVCQFPGCHQTSHLDAHHLLPWSQGGPTDLDNLVLLCRRHHVAVHEGGIIITSHHGPLRFHFALPDGDPITGTWRETDLDHAYLPWLLARYERKRRDPGTIFPPHAGAGFSLHECVEVLFRVKSPPPAAAA